MEGNYAILGKIIETCFIPNDYITTESLKVIMKKNNERVDYMIYDVLHY